MPSAWGLSWGRAWGDSWGILDETTVTPTALPPPGGVGISGRLHLRRPPISRVHREVLDKERLSLEARQAIEEVARRQAERLELDTQKRFEELSRELELRSVEWEARYLDLLNEERESLIHEEIGTLLRRKLAEEDEMLLILLAASL